MLDESSGARERGAGLAKRRALGQRMEAVLELLEPCQLLLDVGTDHAQIPVEAVRRELAKRAIASDLREGPLQMANSTVRRYGLSERVLIRQGDGLTELGELRPDALVLAGMSGELMVKILRAAEPAVLGAIQQCVLQANQDVPSVRRFAYEAGYHLKKERLVQQGERFFHVGSWRKQAGRDLMYELPGWTQEELFHVGPRLLQEGDKLAQLYAEQQTQRLRHWVEKDPARHRAELALWSRVSAFYRSQRASVST